MNICCQNIFGFSTPENADGQSSRITNFKPVPYQNRAHNFRANFKKVYNFFISIPDGQHCLEIYSAFILSTTQNLYTLSGKMFILFLMAAKLTIFH